MHWFSKTGISFCLMAALSTASAQQVVGDMTAADASVKGSVVLVGTGTRLLSGSSVNAGGTAASVRLARGGELRICPHTGVAITTSQNGRDLQIALNTGAVETHYAIRTSADSILTPDFRILFPGPGTFHFAIASDARGNTCVRSLPGNASSLVVTEVLGDGIYQVQPTDQVYFKGGRVANADPFVPPDCGCGPPQAPVIRAETEPPAVALPTTTTTTTVPVQQASNALITPAPAGVPSAAGGAGSSAGAAPAPGAPSGTAAPVNAPPAVGVTTAAGNPVRTVGGAGVPPANVTPAPQGPAFVTQVPPKPPQPPAQPPKPPWKVDIGEAAPTSPQAVIGAYGTPVQQPAQPEPAPPPDVNSARLQLEVPLVFSAESVIPPPPMTLSLQTMAPLHLNESALFPTPVGPSEVEAGSSAAASQSAKGGQKKNKGFFGKVGGFFSSIFGGGKKK